MGMSRGQFESLLKSLTNETDQLMGVVSGLTDAGWERATPAVGWTIHDQVVHLAYFDEIARTGFTDADEFHATKDSLLDTGPNWVDAISYERRDLTPETVMAWLRAVRSDLVTTFRKVGPDARTPWFGPSMSAASSATARFMETWAHGQDVYDAMGLEHVSDDGIASICHLGVLTRQFSYSLHGREAPDDGVRVELALPSGESWSNGAPDSAHTVTGIAEDFALVVTQRRHVDDTALRATSGPAMEWLSLAQAFAGSPGIGRRPGMWSTSGSAGDSSAGQAGQE